MAWLVALCEWCAGGRRTCTVDRFTAGCGERPGLHLWIPRYPASQSRSQLLLRKAQPEQPDDAKENPVFSRLASAVSAVCPGNQGLASNNWFSFPTLKERWSV